MTQPYPILYVEGDVDGDGTLEEGEFHMRGNVDVDAGVRTGYVMSDQAGQINAFLGNLIGDGQSQQQGFYLSFGGGTLRWTIDFLNWEGSTLQWGDTGSGGSATDATGDSGIRQQSVFVQYLSVADLDSRGLATLEYGEWSESGYYDPVGVVLEDPSIMNPSDNPSGLDGSMTLLAAKGLQNAYDAQEQDEY